MSIVTPNHVHYVQSAACLEAGLDVICDKPLTTNLADAEKLVQLAASKKRLLGVTFNYTGYPMIRHAKQLIADGADRHAARGAGGISAGLARHRAREDRPEAGELAHRSRSWPARARSATSARMPSSSRSSSPARKVAEVAADVSAIVPGRAIDDNVNVLLRFANGARGSLWASQVAIGHLNSHRLRVYGETGSIQWFQERPEELLVVEAGRGRRAACAAAIRARRRARWRCRAAIPEGFIEAFSQLYTDFAERVTARLEIALAEGGVAVCARCGHRHARHGVHRSGVEVGPGEQRLDQDLKELDSI